MTRDELIQDCRRRSIILPPSMLVRQSVAARILGVHPNTLKTWHALGKGPRTVPLGGQKRYPFDELLAHINGLNQPERAQ